MVLSLNCKVIVLDEITVGSDYVMKKSIWDALNSVACTRILISHDMQEVRANSNKIFVLRNGKSRQLEKIQTSWVIVCYDRRPSEKFVSFFDKYMLTVDNKEELKQIEEVLEKNNIVFTIDEVGLEREFVD